MHYRWLMIAWLLAALLPRAADAARLDERTYEGVAYDQDSGRELYREQHEVRRDESDVEILRTTYVNTLGVAFATRTARFERSSLAPDFEFHDTRVGYMEGAQWQGDSAVVFKRVGGQRDEAIVDLGKRPFVIDAGFDRLIDERWGALHSGETIRFDFLNPDRLESIPFRVRLVETRQTDSGEVSDFEMSLSNPMLRWLVDTIIVSYRHEDRSLYQYRGVSNIKNPDGEGNFMVRIEYPERPRPLSAPDGISATGR